MSTTFERSSGQASRKDSRSDLNSASQVENLIEIEDLVVKFGDFRAVDGINIHVRRGEMFAFLGPNGAGKSTTIRVLIGCQKPTSGNVRVAGHLLPDDLAKVKKEFGYVPDTDNHMDEFTGRENLQLFADLYEIVDRNRIDAVLAQLELSEAADVAVKNYSKGMRRKLLIAREILHRPKILFLDEPTANLDLHSTAVVRKMLRELAREGVTIFLTTHDMEEVEEICDRAAILCRGKLVALDTPSSFIARYSESRVSIQFEENGEQVRKEICLDEPGGRDLLLEYVATRENLRLRSQDFHFDDVFLKITGQAYA